MEPISSSLASGSYNELLDPPSAHILLVSCLAYSSTLMMWGRGRYVPPKRRSIFIGLHCVTSYQHFVVDK
jgi:hypothetical protein